MDASLCQFYRQYLQQVQNLIYPSPKLLALSDIQQQLFTYFFDQEKASNLPPHEFQRKVLKRIVAEIVKEVKDENDEISDDLMAHMGCLSSLSKQSEFELAQEPRVLSYFIPDVSRIISQNSAFENADFDHVYYPRVLVRESPQVLAAGSNVGLRTWEACLRLGYYLCTSKERSKLTGANVLELGAGTGLLSLLCSMYLGAKHVIATDGLLHVVNGIEENINLNSNRYSSQQQDVAMPNARVLDWTDPSTIDDVLMIGEHQPGFDYILGADITYHPELLDPLASLISLLSARFPACRVLISATVRNERTLSLWRQSCLKHGLIIREVNSEDDQWECPPYRSQTGLFHEQLFPILIMDISK